MKQAEIDGGTQPGTTTDDKKRIADLERENRELRRANEILKVVHMLAEAHVSPATTSEVSAVVTSLTYVSVTRLFAVEAIPVTPRGCAETVLARQATR